VYAGAVSPIASPATTGSTPLVSSADHITMPASRYAGDQFTPSASMPTIPTSTSAASRIGSSSTGPL
jgi:hypothetical protein